MGALLEVRDLEVDIPLAAGMLHPVRSVSFSVNRAETLCIVGESGCGKSLTALALMGLLPRRAIRRAAQLSLDGIDLIGASQAQMTALRGSRMTPQELRATLELEYQEVERTVIALDQKPR